MRRSLSLAFSLALLTACAEPPAVVATSVDPIVNGSEEYGFDSVVTIGADINGNVMSLCSANLIAPRVLLTAGHCGEGIPIEVVVGLGQAFFGYDIEDPAAQIGFVDMEIHPDYVPLQNGAGGTLGEYDLNVMILDEDAPFRPTLFRTDELVDDDLGAEMISVGFGVTSAGGAGSGVKRSATLTLDSYDDMFLISETQTNPGEATVCSGDSGGPQFFDVDGEWVQGAVHSWSDMDCAYRSGSTRVDIVAEWLLDHIEEIHGSRDPCEYNGWYDDGECDEVCDEVDPDCVTPDPADDDDDLDDDDGCRCALADSGPAPSSLAGVTALVWLALRRRRLQ